MQHIKGQFYNELDEQMPEVLVGENIIIGGHFNDYVEKDKGTRGYIVDMVLVTEKRLGVAS